MMAPIITDNGAVSVAGGLGGHPTVPVTQDIRAGGGGGGASGGDGGDGRTARAGTTANPLAARDGQDGYVFESLFDPTAMF